MKMVKEIQQKQNKQKIDKPFWLGRLFNFFVVNVLVLIFYVLVLSLISWAMNKFFAIKMTIVWNLIVILILAFAISPLTSKIDWGYKIAYKYKNFLDNINNK